MYITCQQCDTIFRLDESLIKPNGSKVRCCQCRNVFVTYPPESEKTEFDQAGLEETPSVVPPAVSEASLDQELEGIDLAELDSILEQDKGMGDQMPASSTAGIDAGIDDAAVELDDNDLDLDFTIEPEEQPEQPQEAATDMEIDGLDLDMDFELDDGLDDDAVIAVDESDIGASDVEPLEVDAPSTAEELERELDALDLSLDDGVEIESQPALEEEASEGLDLLDADLDLDKEEPETAAPESEDQELGLSLEDEEQPALDLATEEPAAPEAEPETATDDLDLSDLDDLLGLDEETEQAALDLPDVSEDEDLELSLDDDTDTAESDLAGLEIEEESELKLDEEPVLELDDEPDSDAGEELQLDMTSDDLVAEAPAVDGDNLDLSDLDAMLSEAPDGSEAVEETSETHDLELELDDDAAVAETTSDDLEDLSFELDSEFKDEPALETPEEDDVSAADDGEIDLTDIEEMLEGDETAATLGLASDSAEAADDSGEKWAEDGEVELDDSDDFDLTEIEAAIDAADEAVEEDISIEEELSLDDDVAEQEPEQETEPEPEMELELDDLALELESSSKTVEIEPEASVDDSDELDLSDLGALVEDQDAGATTETIDTGEIELEFEVSDGPMEEVAEVSKTADSETADLESAYPIEETLPEQPIEEIAEEAVVAPVKKKRSSKGLLLLLILVLLGGAGYLFYAVSYMGLEIPYLSDYLNPKPKDPAGVMNISTLDINSKFIENEKTGRLFVVTGKVRNGKDTARKLIRLQGKLFTKGKVLAKTEFSYAGVSLKDQELSQQAIADIKKQINNPSGAAATVKALPGQTISFMIVFSDLPDGLDEFAIEVISSMQAQ